MTVNATVRANKKAGDICPSIGLHMGTGKENLFPSAPIFRLQQEGGVRDDTSDAVVSLCPDGARLSPTRLRAKKKAHLRSSL